MGKFDRGNLREAKSSYVCPFYLRREGGREGKFDSGTTREAKL